MEDTQAQPARFSVTPSAESHFSWLRTRLSTERTLMSWVRTSVALVGFGFTIFQFLERLSTGTGAATGRPMAAWALGLLLIAAGMAGLAIAIWEYVWIMRYLWRKEFQGIAGVEAAPWHTPLLGVAFVLLFVSIFAFCAVLLRWP